MGRIVKQIKLIVGERIKECVVMLDSGASVSLIRKDIADWLGVPVLRLVTPAKLHGVDGNEVFSVSEVCCLQVEMKDKLLDGSFYIVEKMAHMVIIGADFMQKWDIMLFPKEEDYEVRIDPNAIEII